MFVELQRPAHYGLNHVSTVLKEIELNLIFYGADKTSDDSGRPVLSFTYIKKLTHVGAVSIRHWWQVVYSHQITDKTTR